MFCFLCGILTAFAQLFHLGWTAVDSVFDLATSLVADDRIAALFCSEVTAVAIYFIFISGQQLGCFCGVMDICCCCLHGMNQSAVPVNADIIIIDPEREYSPLVKAMQGEVIHISATSENHINAMDMNSDYGDGANPVILKSEFILSLCEQLIGGSSLGAKQKSIIDRCTASVYRYYQQGNYMGTPPTLQDFREELLKQDEPEAQEIALAIELFTDGSLNTFAKHTNVDTHSRLICYDILDLGKQLQPIGMLVVLDSILNRITQNRAKGRNTFIFIDEIYLLFQHEYSANFLFTLWKRVRKYGAYCTGITQNVDVRPDRALCKAV